MTERLTQLLALGYDINTVCGILREEFQDIEVNAIDKRQIEEFIRENKLVIEERKEEIRGIVHEEILVHTREIVQVAVKGENRVVIALAKKLDQITNGIENLDMSEVDENFKPVNMAIFCQYLEATEKLLKMIGKYAGTDDLRMLTTFKQKEIISAQIKAEGGSLIPGASGPMRDANGNSPKPQAED